MGPGSEGDAVTQVLHGRRRADPVRWAAAGVLAVPAAVVVFADLLGIDHDTPFVQLIAFRPQLAAGLVVLGAVVALGGRRTWPVAGALGVVGLLGLLTVLPRAWGEAPGPDRAGRTLDVLTVNTYLGRADPDALAGIVRDRRPAVVVLPEAGEELQQRLISELGTTRYRSFLADRSRDVSPMTVLVDRSLGSPSVAVDRTSEFPSIVLTMPPGRGSAPGLRIVATHPQSPRPGDTRAWRRDVAGLARWCGDGPPTVVAGDLNASLDHAELRTAVEGCTDAASAVGEGLTGTWPAGVPTVLGAAIDHVLVARGPRARSAEAVDVPGSDHRGLLVRLTTGS